ncbi:MAG: serpin family protein [Candidatus Hydrogenedentes bacterium]|nr:serpin family protein [Candidatus Hydrogenedentota bacterium]
MSTRSLAIAAIVFSLFSCGGAATSKQQPSPREPEPAENATAQKEIAMEMNAFSLELFRALRQGNDPGTNTLASPYSVDTALAMVYAGAKGQTADEMREVLHYDASTSEFHRVMGNLGRSLESSEEYQLNVANALWPHVRYTLLDSYVDLMREAYETDVTRLDYENNVELARQTINDWVEEKTEDRIEDLIPEGVLDSMTRLVLTNAIYFKGLWLSQFKEDDTSKAPFTLLDGSTTKVQMMKQRNDFHYFANDWLQAVDLPYTGERVAMTILLPKDAADLTRLESELTSQWLESTLTEMTEQEIDLSLPRFTMNAKSSLSDVLQGMGMITAFSENADFSGMSGVPDLLISEVIHQAFIEVNEEGTEAAAATGVVMKLTAAPMDIPAFVADHPFVFLLRDTKTACILFTGVLAKPEE